MSTASSLSYNNQHFLLKGKPFQIFSGAIHYFRVVPEYWQDRLLKAKACGLNTVETYVPWNAHEPKPGVFKNTGILDIRRFIQTAADLGLYVIFRPGPFICSEWDFGGLPSWLLADPNMKVRTNYAGYQQAVKRYFDWLLPQVVDLQCSSNGPVIAFQVENEYGCFSDDPTHLTFIRDLILENGVTELLITSDNAGGYKRAPSLAGILPTANGQTVENIKASFAKISEIDKQYPLMVTEFWSGWFDHWGQKHATRSVDVLVKTLEYVLQNKASVNFYMFHGGTNFGFMAGANDEHDSYKPDITSYDYDAPLSEDGRVTEKYWKIKEMLEKEQDATGLNPGTIPKVPECNNRASTPLKVMVSEMMRWSNLINITKKRTTSSDPQFMESYTYENGEIQSYGYIVYQKDLGPVEGNRLMLTGYVRDCANILINGQTVAQINWEVENSAIDLPSPNTANRILDIIVENLGRVNYTQKECKPHLLDQQHKGLNGPVNLDGSHIQEWEVFALDFNDDYLQDVAQSNAWQAVQEPLTGGPALYRAVFQLSPGECADYFVRLDGWQKGIVIVNGFNLGRYWDIGPQRTLYLPAPLLKLGDNEILLFEEKSANRAVLLSTEPCLG